MADTAALKNQKELVYEHLLRMFQGHVESVGGWQSENGVNLDGLLWSLSSHIAEGDFEEIGKS